MPSVEELKQRFSQSQLDQIFEAGQKLWKQEAGKDKVCYFETEHAWPYLREKLVKKAVIDLARGLQDQRFNTEDCIRITSEAFYYAQEADWFRVIQIRPVAIVP